MTVMLRYYGGWAPYVPVAERRRSAEREMAKLQKKGAVVSPMKIEGRTIAATFWGSAWCDNLESYHDYENRLPRGRTYVRNGSVIDLQIAAGEVNALVSGSSIYKVKITIGQVAKAHWKSICADCSGGIDSLVELLQGRFSKGVMERICRQGTGLFPKLSEVRFSYSCPDYASMCKHVAAVLYGVGARLDAKPELLFRLRAVNENDLVANIGDVLPMSKQGLAVGRGLESDDMAALFGLEMGDAPAIIGTEPTRIPTPAPGRKASSVHKKGKPGLQPDGTEVASGKAGPADSAPPLRGRKISNTARMKAAAGSKPADPKGASAKRAARAGTVSPRTAEPQPVEWWKAAATKPPGKGSASGRERVRSGSGRTAKPVS
jgi:uncharacterized Zn finger protein